MMEYKLHIEQRIFIAIALVVTSCSATPPTPVSAACISVTGQPRYRCDCIDRAARRYLDESNYRRLEAAALAINPDESRSIANKMAALVNRSKLMDPSDAGITTADFLMMARKATNQCPLAETDGK
jgi:hypothetical protein